MGRWILNSTASGQKVSAQGKAQAMSDYGYLLERLSQIDAAREHADAAFGGRQKRSLTPGAPDAFAGSKDKCRTIQALARFVILRGFPLHQEVGEPVVLYADI